MISDMDTRVEIALAADDNYFAGLLVTACSIAKYAARECELSYTILDGGIAGADYQLLVDQVSLAHSKVRFRRIEVNDENFKECPIWNGNRMTYARLMLPYLLKDIDYCIYCDVDFLWMRDICELWRERDPNVALISTKDGNEGTLKTDGDWLKEHGFPFDPTTYFCAGLTFFNLKMFRDEGMADKCFEVLELKPPYNDQTVMYVATYGRTKLVEKEKWQVFVYELSQSKIDAGCVIHYAGYIPWKPYVRWFHILGDAMKIWHEFYASLVGLGGYASIRKIYTMNEFCYHRGLYVILRLPVLRQLLCLVLLLIGKRDTWEVFEVGTRRMQIHL